MPRLRPPPALAVALEYARAGIRIFPVAHDKRPLVTDWLNASSADEARIRELWTAHPKALIGVPLKHLNAFALDADRHQGGEDGVDHLNKLVAEHGELPPGPVTETANNGRHYFFKQPDDEPIGNRKLAGGLETRGFRLDNSGGYVVGAGSCLPDGRAWRLAARAPSLLKVIANGGLPQAPDWLINLAHGQSKADHPDPARQQQTANRGRSGAREQAYSAASLDGIARDLSATPRGNRNNVLNVAALKLGTMAARGWIGRSTVEGRLFDAAIANGLVKDDSSHSVRGTIKSGLEAGLKSPHEDLEDRERPRAGSLADAGADGVSVWPPDFQMGPKGLTVQVIKGSGGNTTVEEIWLAAPFEILGRVRDPESRGWARLLGWRDDDGRVHQQTVGDADLHGDAAALCSALAARGLRITTTTSRAHLIRGLNLASVDRRLTAVPRTGWHEVEGKLTFVLPGDIEDGRPVVVMAANGGSPYEATGTLDQWQQSIARSAAAHSRARFAIAAALAAPLLKLAGIDGGGFNFKGVSSRGKTTLLRIAGSVWGRGDERGVVRTWRATGNGVEGTAAMFSDTMLPLDELGVASHHEVGNITYSLAGGVGKQRAQRDGSAKAPNTWRVLVLSTGELGIADKIKEGGGRVRAGQELRIVDIEADAGRDFGVFDSAGPDGAGALAVAFADAAVTYYGTAGPAFVRKIEAEGVEAIAHDVRVGVDAFCRNVAVDLGAGQVLRVATRFGLVAVAGELAIEFGILPWPSGSATGACREIFEDWHRDRGGNVPAEIGAAIRQIRRLLEQHGDARFDPVDRGPDVKPVPNRLGYHQGQGDEKEWLVPPETWRDEFCQGFDARMIAKALVERGKLLPGEGGRRSTQKIRIDGASRRVYVLPATAWLGEAGGDP